MLEIWKFVSRQFERWTLRFLWKIWRFTLEKLKLGRYSHVDTLLRKILKHQTEVNNNLWWLIQVSFLCVHNYFSIILYLKSTIYFQRFFHNAWVWISSVCTENCLLSKIMLLFLNKLYFCDFDYALKISFDAYSSLRSYFLFA